MSRDSSAESLESILASIRRSIAEQATIALEEEAPALAAPSPAAGAAAVDADGGLDAPPIPASLSRQLEAGSDIAALGAAGAGGDAAPIAEAPPAARMPVLTLVPSSPTAAPGTASEPATAPALAAAPAPAVALAPAAGEPQAEPLPGGVAEPGREPAGEQAGAPADPLWFLGQGGAASRAGAQPAGAEGAPAPGMAGTEPKPSRAGVVRGPLPPFFGSPAAGVVKVEMVPDRPGRSPERPTAAMGAGGNPFDGPPTGDGEVLHAGSAPPLPEGAGPMRAASSIFAPPPADGRPGMPGEAQAPQIQALEAMVAELLRPMLRRWLDENMPRLVSAALQAEVMSRRDPKKP